MNLTCCRFENAVTGQLQRPLMQLVLEASLEHTQGNLTPKISLMTSFLHVLVTD